MIGKEVSHYRVLAQMSELSEHQYVTTFYSALVHLGLGETHRVFERLRKPCDDRYPQVAYLRTDPVFVFFVPILVSRTF